MVTRKKPGSAGVEDRNASPNRWLGRARRIVTVNGRSLNGGSIRPMKLAGFAVAAIAAAISVSAPAYADPDTDFDNQLGHFGIYGPHDYNPYLGKIVCHRLGVGVDPDASAAAHFLSINLPRGTTQVQAYQFLGTAIAQYCPDLQGKLQHIPGT
jgi:hypothetical protein